jgi:hypothetical protein
MGRLLRKAFFLQLVAFLAASEEFNFSDERMVNLMDLKPPKYWGLKLD